MNIAHKIAEVSKIHPQKKSVVFSERKKSGSYSYPFYTFKEFEERSNQMAHSLLARGIGKGTRTLLFVRPCLDFSIITFALFKIGAVPVLIDPGMGFTNLLASIGQVKPEAMISMGIVHWIRRFKRKAFANVSIKISLEEVGGNTTYFYKDLNSFPKTFTIAPMMEHEMAAILFTSGGTGIPKGVIYTHGILNAQTETLQKIFKLNHEQVDLPGFPLFALFTLAMGMTSVIPDLDPTRPSQCDPALIVRNILDQQVSFVAGSPAIWEKVGRYCLERNIQLGSVRQVVMFGAPVRSEIHQMYKKILPFGDTYTPYGATECLPVSIISGREILKDKASLAARGLGTCIGKAVEGIMIKIIKTTDIPEDGLDELPLGKKGEIVVSGRQVTPGYFEMEQETRKAKIILNEEIWHRMGDIGYMDHDNNLWFLGRKAHRVEINSETVLYPLQVEAIFNRHPKVKRSALVGIYRQGLFAPGLVIERHDGKTKVGPEFHTELRELGKDNPLSALIKDFFVHPAFPVDVRHNIKIDRSKLSQWAQKKGELNVKKNRV